MLIDLRPLRPDDIDAVHALLSDIAVVRYMLFPLYSRDESVRFLAECISEAAAEPYRSIVRAIVDGATGDLIGLGGIAILRHSEEGELWYLVSPEYWSRGIATEAARRLLRIGFEELQQHRIWASCLPENPASARVLEKIGMRREGYCVRNLKIHGEWKDSYLYAVLAGETNSA